MPENFYNSQIKVIFKVFCILLFLLRLKLVVLAMQSIKFGFVVTLGTALIVQRTVLVGQVAAAATERTVTAE